MQSYQQSVDEGLYLVFLPLPSVNGIKLCDFLSQK